MILTCPACATRFRIDAERVGPEGRLVRCSQCATAWRAHAEPGPALELGLDASVPVEAEVDGAEPPATVAASAQPLPRAFRDQAQAQRRTREAVAVGVVWAGLASAVALLLVCAALFRVDVVRLWPATAGAYAFARLPVNPTGFTVEQVQGGPGLQAGRLAMIVSGLQRNVETGARPAPALRVSLLDHGGRRLASRVVPPVTRVAAGEARGFRVSFLDPPASATEVKVDVAFDVKPDPPVPLPAALRSMAARSGVPHPVHLLPRSPPPGSPPGLVRVETARPLPANSPYALPAAPHG